MPYGRGGAGNIQALEQVAAKLKNDVEGNHATSSQPASHVRQGEEVEPYTRTKTSFGQPTDAMGQGEMVASYRTTGRGGAGNWYSPQQLTETGTFSNAERSRTIGDGTQDPASSTTSTEQPAFPGLTRKVGRGGAGNYAFGETSSEELAALRRQTEEQVRQRVHVEVEKDVEAMLAPPPKARVTGTEFS